MITAVCGIYANVCDRSFIDQYVVIGTWSVEFENCTHVVLKQIRLHVSINRFIRVRPMTTLFKNLTFEQNIDRHMINNVRIRTRARKSELNNVKIDTAPRHFNTSFITTYDELFNDI